jgi:hypothetical protein
MGKKSFFFKRCNSKLARVVVCGIVIELQPWSPIFEKMSSSSRKRGGADPN